MPDTKRSCGAEYPPQGHPPQWTGIAQNSSLWGRGKGECRLVPAFDSIHNVRRIAANTKDSTLIRQALNPILREAASSTAEALMAVPRVHRRVIQFDVQRVVAARPRGCSAISVYCMQRQYMGVEYT
jgi:hypothetical protein